VVGADKKSDGGGKAGRGTVTMTRKEDEKKVWRRWERIKE
jgi:hypothetical protein